ncbi:MAG: rhodanese-like domain-containing protein [Thiohalomonadales bacterium]
MKILISIVSSFLILSFVNNTYAGEKVSPESVKGATTVDATKAKSLYDTGVLFVDVRSDKDWAAGRIPKAVHIELKKQFTSESLAKNAKKSDKIVIYCNGPSCLRSSQASAKAVEWGYSKVFYFREGLPAWKVAGYSSTK